MRIGNFEKLGFFLVGHFGPFFSKNLIKTNTFLISGANLIRYTIMVGFLANGFELILFLLWPIFNRLFISKSRADSYIVQVNMKVFFRYSGRP